MNDPLQNWNSVAESENIMEKTLRVIVEGRPYNVTVTDDLAATAPQSSAALPPVQPVASGGVSLPEVSPLTGVIDSIDVAVGATIAPGDQIITIEAMKMKTAIHATNGGVVRAISVKVGDHVDAGQTLMLIG